MSFEIATIGVTEDNKDQVCNSIGAALGGSPTYCSFEGPQSDRRRLNGATTLYMDVSVSDANLAKTKANDFDFNTLHGLPDGVTITVVAIAGTRGCFFIFIYCIKALNPLHLAYTSLQVR